MLRFDLTGLDDGYIQQQGQIGDGVAQLEADTALVGNQNFLYMNKSAGIIGAFQSGGIGGKYILYGYGCAVGEGGTIHQEKGKGAGVCGELVVLAENGNRLIIAVHKEQSLIDQRKQNT